MTPKQKRVLDFIREYIEQSLVPPTYREISDACQISLSSAHRMVMALAKEEHLILPATPHWRGIILPDSLSALVARLIHNASTRGGIYTKVLTTDIIALQHRIGNKHG